MPGFELLLLAGMPLVGVLLIVSAVLRLRKKLSAEQKPTLGTYLNELGGYTVVGLILIVIGVWFLVSRLNSSPTPVDGQPAVQQPSQHAPQTPAARSTKRYSGLGPLPLDKSPLAGSEQLEDSMSLSFVAGSPEAPNQTPERIAFHRGQQQFNRSEWEAAHTSFTTAIHANEKFWPAWEMRGKCQLELGELANAVTDFEATLNLNPSRNTLRLQLAEVYFILSQYDQVIQTLQSSSSQNPAIYNLRGQARGYLGDHRRAIEDLTHALKLNPKDPMYFVNRAFPLLRLGYYEDAMDDCNRAIRLNATLPDAYYMRGRVQRASGDDKKALADLTEAVRLDPEFASAYAQRCELLLNTQKNDLRDVEQAVKDATQACELSGWQDWMPMILLAQAYMEQGDRQQAQQTARQALVVSPPEQQQLIRKEFSLMD